MRSKFVGSLAVTSLGLLLLAACQSQNGSSAVKTGEAADKKHQELPKVYFYANAGSLSAIRPEGSEPKKFEEMQQYFREKVGVDPQAIIPPKGTEVEKLNLLLGAKEKLDVFSGNWDQFASKGVLQPLNELLEKHGPDILKAFPKESWDLMKDENGKIWGIPREELKVSYPTYVRTDWLKKLNLTMPKTLDEYETVLKTFKEKDPDGNGKDDTIPMMTDLKSLRYGLLGAFVDNGYSNWIDPTDKRLKPVELAPGYKDFLAKMADWYQKGYIHKEAFTKHDPLELLRTNRVGSSVKWHSSITLQLPKVKGEFPDMNFDIARELKGAKGLAQTNGPVGTSSTMVTKSAKNPEAAIKFINWMYLNEGENFLTVLVGLEGKDWKWADKQTRTYEILANPRLYAAEFAFGKGMSLERKVKTTSPEQILLNEYIQNETTKTSTAKAAIDYSIPYNQQEITDSVPTVGDIERLKDEETIKFITGARPLSEYDNFVEQLYKAGLDKWIDVYTKQYNKLKK